MQAPLAAHRELAGQHAGDDALGGLAAGRIGERADRGEGLLQDGARLVAAEEILFHQGFEQRGRNGAARKGGGGGTFIVGRHHSLPLTKVQRAWSGWRGSSTAVTPRTGFDAIRNRFQPTMTRENKWPSPGQSGSPTSRR